MSSFNGVSHAINCFGGRKKKKKGNNRQAKKRMESTVDMAKRTDRVGSRVKMSHFKLVENGFGSIGLRVGGWVDPYFSHEFLFFYKENNMYLPLG